MRAYLTGGGPFNGRYMDVPDNQTEVTFDTGGELPDGGQAVGGKYTYRMTGQRVARFFVFALQSDPVEVQA